MTSGLSNTDSELALAVISITVLTLLAYKLGDLFHLRSRRQESSVLVGAVAIAFYLGWYYYGRLVWAETIQTSSALYWSNLSPIALAFASGFAGHTREVRKRYRPIVTACFMVLAIGYVITPIARPALFPMHLGHHASWKGNVCLQSHAASCAPAAAVTLLQHHGIQATEAQLADACLTSTLGTAPLGLYRGLKSTANQHGLEAQVAHKSPDLWLKHGQLPNVALVRFEQVSGDTIGQHFFGSREAGHVITILGKTDGGRWLIGDPAVGKVSWSDEELRERFTGEAIFLKR